MNNHWHTNYRADQEGPTTFRYSIAPHEKFNSDEATRFGTSRTQPLIAVPAQGALAYDQSRLRIDSSRVTVTAFKPSDDGKALIVRLFGASGKSETVDLNWSAPAPKQMWLSDNTEKRLTPIGGAIDVPPYGIVTVRAELPQD